MNEQTTWSAWLQDQLDQRGWRQADLVRESEGHIKRDRVSKWLSGKETPSHKLAIVTANTLGTLHAEALAAAGFTDISEVEQAPREIKLHESLNAIPSMRLRQLLSEFSDSAILAELRFRAMLREQDRDRDDDGGSFSNVIEADSRFGAPFSAPDDIEDDFTEDDAFAATHNPDYTMQDVQSEEDV